eukprot:5629957-Lingulodinium_polyedra.AAC.1
MIRDTRIASTWQLHLERGHSDRQRPSCRKGSVIGDGGCGRRIRASKVSTGRLENAWRETRYCMPSAIPQ